MSFYEGLYNHSPVWMQNLMVSAYGYQWKKRRFGGIFEKEYEQAKERENFTTNQWQRYQQEQLTKILLHAYTHVPYYKEAFQKAGIKVDVLKTITPGNISKIPVLTKEELRRLGAGSLLSYNREKHGNFFASSGSTGTPTQILFSHAMHQRWMALFESRVRNWAGVNSFIPHGMIGGRRVLPKADNQPPFYRYNIFEKQVYFSAYHINAANAKNYLEGMKKYHAAYMTGYAMSNFFLANFFKELQYETPELKCVITSSEKLTKEMRNIFNDVYHCKTYDGWSGVEACGLISECEHGSLHISPDAGLIEVLTDEMQQASIGETGTIYCTGFLNYDQPLIRYNIGDKVILSGKKCLCRREMPVIEEIIGRVEDIIMGKDGRQMVRFHSVFNGLTSVKQAQVIQENADELIIKIVTDGKLKKEEEQIITNRIKSQLGNIGVFIEEVKAIPLNNNGKFQAVISKLKRLS